VVISRTVLVANTLLKDDESARDNHVLACNFAKYLPNIHQFKKITNRESNKFLLIRLLRTRPNLKYIATLRCNLPLIVCFLTLMLHEVVWQHMQRVAGLLVTALLQIYQGMFPVKNCKPINI